MKSSLGGSRAAALLAWIFEFPATAGLLGGYLVLFAWLFGTAPERIWWRPPAHLLPLEAPRLRAAGALTPRDVLEKGQVWRLATATLLHASVLHLALNAVALFQLGRLIENWYGGSALLVLHAVFGVGGNAASVWYHGENTTFVQVGGSGALFGMITFLAVAAHHDRRAQGPRPARVLAAWAVIALVAGFFLGSDNAAHLGGALIGLFCGQFEFLLRGEILPRLVARTAAFLVLGLVVGAFLLQYRSLSPDANPHLLPQARLNAARQTVASVQVQADLDRIFSTLGRKKGIAQECKQIAPALGRITQLEPLLPQGALKSIVRQVLSMATSGDFETVVRARRREWAELERAFRRWEATVQFRQQTRSSVTKDKGWKTPAPLPEAREAPAPSPRF